MRTLINRVLASALLASAPLLSYSATVGSALMQFDQNVRNYNLISFGDAAFYSYGDTEGGLAVQGNLFLDGGAIAAMPHKFLLNGDPTLYVGGALSVSNTAYLQSGYASLSASANGAWNWSGVDNRLTNGGATFSTVNTSHLLGDSDPRLNPGPAGWSFGALKTSFVGISQTLAGAAATGSIQITGQTLKFVGPGAGAHGAIVFDFDANLLSGNTYGGQMFSNVQFEVPAGDAYVINVRNAAGRTLFGGSGINFNSGAGYERLLWNVVDSTPGSVEEVRFGNGGQFFGSVLAPTWSVFNDFGTAINGQVVAGSFGHRGAELHYTGFNYHEEYDYEVPEPSTYGLLGAGACLVLVSWRRGRAALRRP